MGLGIRAATLTLGGSKTSLYAAIVALGAPYLNTQANCSFVQIVGGAAISGGAFVYVGDVNITSSSFGNSLAAAGVQTYSFGFPNCVNLNNIYLLGSTTGLAVNVVWAESA